MKNTCLFVLQWSVKNSYEPLNKIKNLNSPSNAKFISFNVQNLLPSILSKEVLQLVSDTFTIFEFRGISKLSEIGIQKRKKTPQSAFELATFCSL